MPTSGQIQLDQTRAKLARFGQEHLLAFWDELTDPQRGRLLDEIHRIPFELVADLVPTHVRARPHVPLPETIEPADAFPPRPDISLVGKYADAVKRGISLIRTGKVAALTVAGGQGSRLGYDGPKGGFSISPVKNKPLFQLFAEFIGGTQKRYGGTVPWYIMTSPTNDADTKQIFEAAGYFGLPPQQVVFFQQGVMPAVSPDGKIVLDEKHHVALSPDGHGGTLRALAASGALGDMADRGVEYISYFQVDNPLVKCVDPLFIGLHAIAGSEMSSKAVAKVDDLERVGNFVRADGKLAVIEYSDLPDALAHARNDDGSRTFDDGSIAIHVLSRSFVERLTADPKSFRLPWHRADKKVPCIDPRTHRRIEPDGPNAVKLETFIFDAIPLANNPIVLETLRGEEFSPIKNATGVDSAETARRDLIGRAAAWIEACGYDVPRKPDGQPDACIEISPLLALDAAHLREAHIQNPNLQPGQSLYME